VSPSGSGSNGPLYIDSSEAADRFLASIAGTRAIALDTEGASFHRYVDRIYLLQLSTDRRHAIIDPLKVASPTALGTMLESRDVEVVFHDADYDLRLLHQDYGWRVTNIFDTRVAAQLLGVKAFGLAALLDSYFGVRLDKKHQRADWSMRPLPGDMLEYAAQDTMHLLQLRQRLNDDLARKGRLHWAQEEFERLEGTQWDESEEDTSFLRIKGARDLTRRELAILRELVAWRDGVAKGTGSQHVPHRRQRRPAGPRPGKGRQRSPRSRPSRDWGAALSPGMRGQYSTPSAAGKRFPNRTSRNSREDLVGRAIRITKIAWQR
jgi:ribonuclease D